MVTQRKNLSKKKYQELNCSWHNGKCKQAVLWQTSRKNVIGCWPRDWGFPILQYSICIIKWNNNGNWFVRKPYSTSKICVVKPEKPFTIFKMNLFLFSDSVQLAERNPKIEWYFLIVTLNGEHENVQMNVMMLIWTKWRKVIIPRQKDVSLV